MSRAELGQIKIDFEAGLVEQFPCLKDVVRAAVYGCSRPFKHIAADLGVSPARLSRMLADSPAQQTKLNFPVDLLAPVIESTSDRRPVYWLIEKFLEDPDAKRGRALDELSRLVPVITRLIGQAGSES